MPFCPECASEFEPWVITCPDCGRALVAELPQEQQDDLRRGEPALVELASFPSEALALMWAEALEREGIGVVLKTGGITIGGVFAGPIDDYRLFVESAKLEAARGVLGLDTNTHPKDFDYRV